MQCFHCDREVRETRHAQKRYRVDYYLLHTGKTESAFLKDPDDDTAKIHYLKLSDPVDIITCIDCYAVAEIRQKLRDDFNNVRSIVSEQPTP